MTVFILDISVILHVIYIRPVVYLIIAQLSIDSIYLSHDSRAYISVYTLLLSYATTSHMCNMYAIESCITMHESYYIVNWNSWYNLYIAITSSGVLYKHSYTQLMYMRR